MKERILQEVDVLFTRYGVKGITMEDIAREMGISKKTIYLYFENKDDLVMQWCDQFLRMISDSVGIAAENSINAIEESVIGSEGCLSMFSKLNPMVMHDIKKYYPMVEAQKSEYFEKIQGHLKKMIERGIKEKIFRIDINSSIAAKINFTLMNNCFETNDFSQEHFSLLENIHQTQEIFLGGLCNEEGFKILNHLRITKFKIPTQ